MFPICGIIYSQPDEFSWDYRHKINGSYISPAKNQHIPGPCLTFASVAAVEAMAEIYYNKISPVLNLSESSIFNIDCGPGCDIPIDGILDHIISNGVIDDQSMPFPTSDPYCLTSCPTQYNMLVRIPKYTEVIISSNDELKRAIMDHGPIIMVSNVEYGDKIGLILHPNKPNNNVNHTVLVIGWNNTESSVEWRIKDSWQDDYWIKNIEVNFFAYGPTFYYINPVDSQTGLKIRCVDGNNCGYFSMSEPQDFDKDGFYNWGLDTEPKPDGWPGINKMDFNDRDPYVIFRDGYEPLKGPYISDTTSKWLCSSGKSFTLKEFSALSNLGFTVDWNVSPANYFSSNSSGSDTTTNIIVPIPGYVGKKGKIEYRLKYNGNVLTTYQFEFYLIGPRENYVSISVLDSYGGSPENSDFYYYICPNTNYTISYNNYDQSCYTSNFSWELPYGWTTNYSYNNLISINTNDYPYGMVQIKATTSCCGSNVILKDLYFGEANCGEYFMSYPNPADDYVNIDIIKDKFPKEEDTSSENSILTVVDGSGIVKSRFNFRGFPYSFSTGNLPEGLYFINIQYKDIKSTVRLSVKR